MKTTNYPSDLTNDQYALIEPHLPAAKRGGRSRAVNLHTIVNAIFYVNRTGCPWRYLPKDYGPWSTAYDYFRKWRIDGTWEKLNAALWPEVRQAAGRDPDPSMTMVDSQSVKTTELGGISGYDGGKKVDGRKRHIAVDTLGMVLAVLVMPADVQDGEAAPHLMEELTADAFPRLKKVLADSAYAKYGFPAWVAEHGWYELEISPRPKGSHEFIVQRFRWIVERTFAWLGRYRRHSKDYERNDNSSTAMIQISMIHLMIRRLVKTPKKKGDSKFKYRK